MFSDQYASSGSPYQQPYAPPTQPGASCGTPLQFYTAGSANDFPGARPSLDGHVTGTMGGVGGPSSFGGTIQPIAGWWSAFGTGGFEGEPPLLEGVCSVCCPLSCCV